MKFHGKDFLVYTASLIYLRLFINVYLAPIQALRRSDGDLFTFVCLFVCLFINVYLAPLQALRRAGLTVFL